MPTPYRTKTDLDQFKPTLAEAEEIMDGDGGWCLNCGTEQTAEPDATKYTCPDCGLPKVYGIEELCLMGLVDLTSG